MELKDQHFKIIGVCLGGILAAYLLSSCFMSGGETEVASGLVGNVPAPKLLDEHTEEFRREIIKVTDGIHVAVGYAVANSILIEAPEGAIIVDVTESLEAAEEIYAAFRNITRAPIKAIIYTHNHADHMYGAEAFMREEEDIEIWAHKDLPYLVDATTTALPITYRRASYQFGTHLKEKVPSAFRNVGIGPFLRISRDKKNEAHLIPPTHLLTDSEMEVVIAGLPVTLVHIPGETMDQMGLWIPSKQAFLCADDVYKAFPNLYAIRGTPARDTRFWSTSVDKMIEYEPEYLIGSHCRPLSGKDYVKSVLTVYRDAIMFVHDQTVRFMNKGMYPDDIVAQVKLPKHMAEHPYLVPYYGSVEWSVRAVFDRYMGWFSGNIIELSKHTTGERAERMVTLGGGKNNMITAAVKAFDDQDFRWALEVATYVFTAYPDNEEAKKIRTDCLKVLASQQMSANGRNYYLTTALHDHGLLNMGISKSMSQAAIMAMTPQKLFDTFSLRLKAEDIEGVDKVLVFDLTDIGEQYTLHIRNSVMNVKKRVAEKWNCKITIDFVKWKGVLLKETSALTLYKSGEMIIEGGLLTFKEFMDYFETN